MSLGYSKMLQFLTQIKNLLSGDPVRDREVIAPPPRDLNPQKGHPMYLSTIAFTLPRDGTIACDVKNLPRSSVHYWQSAVKSIDANKENDQAYNEPSLQLLRRGALIAIDHVL